MRVGFILPALQKPSGWRTYALGLIGELSRRVEGVLFVPAQELADTRDVFPNLRRIPLPATQSASLRSLGGAWRLWQTYQSVRSVEMSLDLVHSLEAYPTGLVGHWLSKLSGCPHIITAHGTYGVIWQASFFDRLLYRQVLRCAAHLCPVSNATSKRIQQFFGEVLTNVPITPVLNGNDFYQSVPPEVALNRRLPETPTLLSVGEVKPRKGYQVSLQVFARLREKIPRARYDIVGFCPNNAYTQRLREMMNCQSIAGVTFHGSVSQTALASFYERASLFVLTPQEETSPQKMSFEGFGLVYLEAGAYGLPVIASDCGGVAEAVRHGETGYVYPPTDVDGMVQAAYRLLTDEQLNLNMGRANRRWAETLTWERAADQFLQIYQKAVSGR